MPMSASTEPSADRHSITLSGLARVAHQAEAPDLAGERPQARADLEVEFFEQRLAHLRFPSTHRLRDAYRVHLRQPAPSFDQELEAHRFEAGLEREVVAHVARPGVLDAFLLENQQRLVQRESALVGAVW